MPNPSGLMNGCERQICSRLKALREAVGCSQHNFAATLGVSYNRLASIEYGRTPLRLEIAVVAARITGCNLVWLAEGVGPMFGPLPSLRILSSIKPRTLFRNAWKVTLKPLLPREGKDFGQSRLQEWPQGGASVESYLHEEVTGALGNLPPQFHPNFFAHVTHAVRDFVEKNQALINAARLVPINIKKKYLTETATSGIPFAVKHQMPNLLSRLKKATQEAGKMSALASFLSKATGQKVPLASVSRWLSGKREPGGEIALLMLYWVEHPELQK